MAMPATAIHNPPLLLFLISITPAMPVIREKTERGNGKGMTRLASGIGARSILSGRKLSLYIKRVECRIMGFASKVNLLI